MSILPVIPVAIPCDDCGTLGAPDDPRVALYIVTSGKPDVSVTMLCPECARKRIGGLPVRQINRRHAVQIFEHYAGVMGE